MNYAQAIIDATYPVRRERERSFIRELFSGLLLFLLLDASVISLAGNTRVIQLIITLLGLLKHRMPEKSATQIQRQIAMRIVYRLTGTNHEPPSGRSQRFARPRQRGEVIKHKTKM